MNAPDALVQLAEPSQGHDGYLRYKQHVLHDCWRQLCVLLGPPRPCRWMLEHVTLVGLTHGATLLGPKKMGCIARQSSRSCLDTAFKAPDVRGIGLELRGS